METIAAVAVFSVLVSGAHSPLPSHRRSPRPVAAVAAPWLASNTSERPQARQRPETGFRCCTMGYHCCQDERPAGRSA